LILAQDVSPSRGNPNPPKRSEIKGFSAASRKRMIRQCAMMGKAVPVFVTLTYGSDWPSEPSLWKTHLIAWMKRLNRLQVDLSAIWRLEPQKRGAPHFHLLVYQSNGKAPFIDKDWVASSWHEVIGDLTDEHLKAGTRIESLRTCRGAAFYVAKYCAKLPEDSDFPPEWSRAGRLWGVMSKKHLPLPPQKEMILHSHLEQRAVLFAMADAYRSAVVEKIAADYENDGLCSADSHSLAEKEWDKMKAENEYLGNTCTFFGSAEEFLSRLSAKRFELESRLAFEAKFPRAALSRNVDKMMAVS